MEAKTVQFTPELSVASLMAELKEHISNELKKELKEAVVEKPKSVKEIASYFSVSEDTIYRWMRDGDIPFHKVQGRTYFFASECKKMILKS
ncbi:MAG TPA: helix-turn-helix domain-containing protein [Chryseosolibacter sp.]|nr:helix-turn-helix domain-containing protein [Chryseosolibacter sp.]